MEHEKEPLYMLVSCAICGGFQSMEIYVSTSRVVQLGFSQGCNWSSILWPFLLQVKHMPYVKKLFFLTLSILAASYSYRQLYQWRLLPLCPQIPGVPVTAECLLQVTDRAPGRQWPCGRQGKALYPKGQCVIVLMWFLWYFVFQQKPNHISTDCHVQTCKLQMHRSLTAVLYYVFLTNILTFYKSLVHLPNSGSHASLRIFHFPVVSSVTNYQQHFFSNDISVTVK